MFTFKVVFPYQDKRILVINLIITLQVVCFHWRGSEEGVGAVHVDLMLQCMNGS